MKYIFFFLCTITAQAQFVRTSSLGVKAGLNFASLSAKGAGEYNNVLKPNIGVVYTDHIYNFLAGKFELSYSGQGGKYEYTEGNINRNYSIPYLSVAYAMSFNLAMTMRLDAGITADFLLSKNVHIPDQRTFDLAGFMGLEIPITNYLSLEGRIKGGWGTINKSDTNEYPFRNNPKNLVYQVGIVYYFNTDVWKNKR